MSNNVREFAEAPLGEVEAQELPFGVAHEQGPAQRKAAIALGGSHGLASQIPKILAMGRGDMAQKLLDWADEQGLTIEKNSDLAQVLMNLNLGDSVPEEVFMAVAEILYYIYEVNAQFKAKNS